MDEIWDLIGSVYEGFPTYFCLNRVLISLFLSTSKEITSKNFLEVYFQFVVKHL